MFIFTLRENWMHQSKDEWFYYVWWRYQFFLRLHRACHREINILHFLAMFLYENEGPGWKQILFVTMTTRLLQLGLRFMYEGKSEFSLLSKDNPRKRCLIVPLLLKFKFKQTGWWSRLLPWHNFQLTIFVCFFNYAFFLLLLRFKN